MKSAEFEHYKKENERLLQYLNALKPLFNNNSDNSANDTGGGPVLELVVEGYEDYEIELPK